MELMFGLVWTGSVHGDGDLATSRDCLEHMALTPEKVGIRFPYMRLCIFLGALDPETFMQHVGDLKYFGVKSRTLLLLRLLHSPRRSRARCRCLGMQRRGNYHEVPMGKV